MYTTSKSKEGLLVEHSVEFIVESTETVTLYEGDVGVNADNKEEGVEFLKLIGVFQKGNYPNGNKRVYKTELLSREVNKFQSKISQGLALGKIYHPGFFDQGGPAGVTDVSHRITKLWVDEDIVRGELLVFKTASGKDVKAIVDGGGRIGISSRGYGSMKRYDNVKIAGVEYKDVWVVDDNYRLETFDLVLTPSVKTAIMRPVKESWGEHNKEGCKEGPQRKGEHFMTIEELKSLHPELYNKIRDAAVKEGKVQGVSEAEAIASLENKSIQEKNDSLLEENKTLLEENGILKTENKNLKDKIDQVEAEKLEASIRIKVKDIVEKSNFKSYFQEEDISFIVGQCNTVEDAVKEVEAREKVYENVISTFKAQDTVYSNSRNDDTSEDNSDGVNESKEKKEISVKNEMRAMAGL